MNALARSQPLPQRRPGGGTPEVTWAEIALRAPVMVATMASYLDQLEVSARPGTVAQHKVCGGGRRELGGPAWPGGVRGSRAWYLRGRFQRAGSCRTRPDRRLAGNERSERSHWLPV